VPPWPGNPPAGPVHNPYVNAPPPMQGQPYQGYGAPPQADDWLAGAPPPGQGLFPDHAPQAPAPAPAQKIPLEVALNARDGAPITAVNPMLAAATPLLILLGRLRLMIIDLEAQPLMQHVANRIIEFERYCLEAGLDPQEVSIAKYVLCGTADDIVQNLPGTDTHIWLQYSMLAQFFQRRTSGVGFYEELAKLMHNPAPHYDLLELMHACLSLGFEGQYRGSPNGANDLQRIRRDVYQTLRHIKGRSDEDVSPHWQGLDLKMRVAGTRVPVWAVASAAGAILLGAYFVFRLLLGGDVDTLADRLVALVPTNQITLERKSAFVPAKIADTRDPTQLERIRAALADDIKSGCVGVDSVGDSIVIKVCNNLFASGSATVQPKFADVAQRVASALAKEPGSLHLVGYTDNVKPSGLGKFKSNYDLSVARAKAVAQVMEETITDPSRFTVEGRGELDPVADNSTDEGRAQNRRVEILVPRQETLKAGQAVADAAAPPAAAVQPAAAPAPAPAADGK
jgi:type VI secretion system protein ImpK